MPLSTATSPVPPSEDSPRFTRRNPIGTWLCHAGNAPRQSPRRHENVQGISLPLQPYPAATCEYVAYVPPPPPSWLSLSLLWGLDSPRCFCRKVWREGGGGGGREGLLLP
eukprot:Sspe_Gene.87180::Locus_58151_Transcript_1_1_Confidence_1.000_Length_1694::g.87180::m.87180